VILGIDQLGTRLKEQYDKVIAFTVLLLLVSSLVYLGVKVGNIRQMQEEFDGWLKTRTPRNPHAAQIEPTVYNSAVASIKSPFVLEQSSSTNGAGSMFVPQTRFSCRDCRMPVPINAEKCPHCNIVVVPPEADNPDADGDGMPTVWEEKYGLDPFDPTDAAKDNDSDGYSNLTEYREGKFDPTDPNSHPAAVEKLKLISITGEKFGLQFKSRIKTRSGYKFALNYRLPSGEQKTDFVSIGDTVAGVKIVKYEEKLIEVRKNFPKEDRSELTVEKKDGEKIILVIGKRTLHINFTAHLELTLPDGEIIKIDASKNDEFEVEGAIYKVIDIDGDKGPVIIRGKSNQKKIVIRLTSESV